MIHHVIFQPLPFPSWKWSILRSTDAWFNPLPPEKGRQQDTELNAGRSFQNPSDDLLIEVQLKLSPQKLGI